MQAILTLQDLDECQKFFPTCAPWRSCGPWSSGSRWRSSCRDGMIYNDILERTGASSATISRVNRSLQYGADGYQACAPPRHPKETAWTA
ncbi:MAG: YerC/YecD family TrpR-related protein [Oscillospiraceae bacterium]